MGDGMIRLFGRPLFPGADGNSTLLGARETELIAYLCLNRRRHARTVLAGVLWPTSDERGARRSLNTALWRLRRTLESVGVDPRGVIGEDGTGDLHFEADGLWDLDVHRFELAADGLMAREPIEPSKVDRIAAGLALHRADLLEGYYQGWVVTERERLRLRYINGQARLMRYHCERNPLRAIELGEAILRFDPLREAVHRELMILHVTLGQRSLALRQYERCRQVLIEELGVGPTEATRVLHGQILREDVLAARSSWRSS